MSDVVWQALIAACLAVAMKLIADRSAAKAAKRAVEAADKVAVKTEEVRTDLESATIATDIKLRAIAETGEKVHKLVNANMGVQLTISAVALGRVAELTKHSNDILAWNKAKAALEEHDKQQASVDAAESKEQ